MKQITAHYNSYSKFEIPDEVYLLPYEENEEANEGTYGSWWIKWGTLYYYNQTGEVCLIESFDEDTDRKWPVSVDVEEE